MVGIAFTFFLIGLALTFYSFMKGGVGMSTSVKCPNCGARIALSSIHEIECKACGHEFDVSVTLAFKRPDLAGKNLNEGEN